MAAQPQKSVDVDTSGLQPGMDRPPPDVQHLDGIMTAWDGLELYWQTWEPSDDPTGVIVLMHGFGEHSARYHHVASLFVRAGYAVIAIDARGHGRSAGPRGHIDRFAQFPRDLDLVVGEAEKRWPGRHLVVFGHSNGGLIALHHALMTQGRVAAYAVTSPFVGFQVKVPFAKVAAGTVMSKIWPTLALPTELDPALLTHDTAIVEKYANDPLVLSVASARWFTETKRAQAELMAQAAQVKAPFLFLVAGRDEIADPRTAEEIYHQLGSTDREFELLGGLMHEVLNEAEWERLARRIVDWFERFR